MYETRTAHGVTLWRTTSLEHAKQDARDYRHQHGTHCEVMRVESVWSTRDDSKFEKAAKAREVT